MTILIARAPTRCRERDRVEALIRIDRPGHYANYLCEVLLSPEHPQNIGQIRWIGGAIEPGETPTEALIRELIEEYGIFVRPRQVHPHHAWSGRRGAVYQYRVEGLLPGRLEGKRSRSGNEQLIFEEFAPPPWRH